MLWSISGGGPEVDLLPLPPPRPLPPLPPRPRPLFPLWTNIPGEVAAGSTRTCTPLTPSCPGIPTFPETKVTLLREASPPVAGEWGGLGVDGRLGEYWILVLPEYENKLRQLSTWINSLICHFLTTFSRIFENQREMLTLIHIQRLLQITCTTTISHKSEISLDWTPLCAF